MTAFAPATLAVIAIGGAAGALARHGVNTWSAAAFGHCAAPSSTYALIDEH